MLLLGAPGVNSIAFFVAPVRVLEHGLLIPPHIFIQALNLRTNGLSVDGIRHDLLSKNHRNGADTSEGRQHLQSVSACQENRLGKMKYVLEMIERRQVGASSSPPTSTISRAKYIQEVCLSPAGPPSIHPPI
jgi:hypothetical protein